MPKRVFITGMGINSAIGLNAEENLNSLRNKRSGIESITHLETKHKNEFLVGEVKYSNKELSEILKLNSTKECPRTGLLALKAATEAFHSARLSELDPQQIGIIGGTTVGGMDKTEKHYLTPENNPDFILTHSSGYITELVAKELHISGYLSTLNTACSSSTNAIISAARLIKHGYVKAAIAGGFDSLSKFTLNGFKSLMILTPGICTPFDENRKGLNLGEGSGFIVLESEESAMERGITPICELTGYANTNDAYHQTASSPNGEGAYLSMKKALEKADLKPDDIDYINVHGTGTDNNDLTEGVAIKRLFKEAIPDFSSTKSFTGHTLGAAGGIEAVYSILALKNNLIYPNLNFKNAISEIGISPTTELINNKEIHHVMSNSFGFGGNDSSLIFSKV